MHYTHISSIFVKNRFVAVGIFSVFQQVISWEAESVMNKTRKAKTAKKAEAPAERKPNTKHHSGPAL
jgi:hypothetical protein